MLAHASGLQREPPGEVWETLEFPGRGGAARPARRRRAGAAGRRGLALLEPRLRPARPRRRAGLRHAVSRLRAGAAARAARARRRTTWGPEAPAAKPYFVEPYSDSVRREPELELGGKGGESGLYSTVGDLARWGSFLCAPDESVLAPRECGRDAPAADHGRARLDARLGPRDRALAARRADLRRAHRRLSRASSRCFVYSRRDRVGAVVLTNSGSWPKLSATGLAARWRPRSKSSRRSRSRGRPRSRRPRRSCRCSDAGGRRGARRSSAGASGKLEARPPPRRRSASRRCSSRRATTASAPSREASAERLLRVVRDEQRRGREALLGDVSVHAGARALRPLGRRGPWSRSTVRPASSPRRAYRGRARVSVTRLCLERDFGSAVAGGAGTRAPRTRRRRRAGTLPSGGRGRRRARAPTSERRAAHRRELDRPERERQRRLARATRAARPPASRAARPARSRRRRSRVASRSLPAAGDHDRAAVLGRVADDRHDHRRR